MKSRLAAQRYARALSQVLADEELQTALDQLAEFRDAVESHHDLYSALNNPAIRLDTRGRILDAVLDKLGALDAVRKMLHELMRRERIGEIGEVIDAFSNEVNERLQRVTVVVTTAHDLSPEDEARLIASFREYTAKAVHLEKTKDPDVIGGVRARIGDTIIDGTLRAQLTRLRESLLAQEIV